MEGNYQLLRPEERHADQIKSYREEMLARGSSMDGTGGLRREEDPLVWIRSSLDAEDPEKLRDERWVQATQFVCERLSDGCIVGMIQVRHNLSVAYLRDFAGHIGYSVRPSERRKGIATWMLAHTLPFCWSLGLEKVLISCEPDNPGSRGTILANGGVYEKTVFEPQNGIYLERYWIAL